MVSKSVTVRLSAIVPFLSQRKNLAPIALGELMKNGSTIRFRERNSQRTSNATTAPILRAQSRIIRRNPDQNREAAGRGDLMRQALVFVEIIPDRLI
jgi:hypothetical protein